MKLWMNILFAIIGYVFALLLGISTESALILAFVAAGMMTIAYQVGKIKIVLQHLLEYLLENSKSAK